MTIRFAWSQAWGTLVFSALSSVALAGHHGGCEKCGDDSHLGGCASCATIWDDYCETKPRCIKPSKLIHKIANINLRPNAGCSCASAGGVGLYGPWGGCPTCGPTHGHGHSLLGLFKKKHLHGAADPCDSGCDANMGGAGAGYVGSFGGPYSPPTAAGCSACGGGDASHTLGTSAPVSSPAYTQGSELQPILAPAAAPATRSEQGVTRPVNTGSAPTLEPSEPTPDPIPPAPHSPDVPPAPLVPQAESLPGTDATRGATPPPTPEANSGAFRWLKKNILVD